MHFLIFDSVMKPTEGHFYRMRYSCRNEWHQGFITLFFCISPLTFYGVEVLN